MLARPWMLVFGSQTPLPQAQIVLQIKASLLLDSRLQSFRSVLEDLPQFWNILLAVDPTFDRVPGQKTLEYLVHWLTRSDSPAMIEKFQETNTLLMPLTVILHVVQYFSFIDSRNGGQTHDHLLEKVRTGGGIQGFCAGLLAAVAVAGSKDEEEVCHWAGTALRLAVCIGAYVDVDGLSNKTECIAVKWKNDTGYQQIINSLKKYPAAYISVYSDSSCVTIIVPKTVFKSLSQELVAHGLTIKALGISGQFHSAANIDGTKKLVEICNSHLKLHLPFPSKLHVPVYSNADSQVFSRKSPIAASVLESILVQTCNWNSTILMATAGQQESSTVLTIVQFGLADCIPSSIRTSDTTIIRPSFSRIIHDKASYPIRGLEAPNEPVAVIGMACKFPGANSPMEFWDLISAGTSMCRQMLAERFKTAGTRRSPDGMLKFWGNFIDDADAFDHHFFKRSAREAASMDPQQRLILEVVYQALESAEYFGRTSGSQPNNVGVYVGMCAADYNDNVSSHPPNAYSTLGTLRAFISGRVSHFFGWNGPSITFDTACSSSAVAIHAACKALQAGESSMALAGGVNIFTSPNFYQNLAAASFLSPTGPTKPFDIKGDGYCRGEGIGLVVLKRLSDAIADQDNVLGVIAATAVNQNMNSTAITIPHSESLVHLFQKVTADASLRPHEISYIEAHGTGTPIGDPIEMASIRKVFAGASRTTQLHIASVKGNIGHLEGSSGVASLIKVILMMEHKQIPVQANFNQLNPKITPLEVDNINIPLSTQPWKTEFQAACINNYGAAGSNAAMVVYEPAKSAPAISRVLPKYPIYISANSEASLKGYCSKTLGFLEKLNKNFSDGQLLSSLAFNLASKQNRSLPFGITTSVTSLEEFKKCLSAGASGSSSARIDASTPRPVVLVFGGQTGTSVGLSRAVFDSSALFRSHLERCDALICAAGFQSIFPSIFQTEPVQDVVLLHSLLFSVQYSCAKSWIESGLLPDAVIGHSFGQLTALTICNTLSLEDGLKLVTGRAELIKRKWGSEPGSMISLQADIDTVQRVIASTNQSSDLEIACYNGPASHVLVAGSMAIDAVEATLNNRSQFSTIKFKKLNVTNGFHSAFTDPLLPGLGELAQKLTFNHPTIPIETCTKSTTWSEFNATRITEHTRNPVYFAHAVDRIASRLGQCTWLESGTASGVIGLVHNALKTPLGHEFQAIKISGTASLAPLADLTVNLWKSGHKVQFWPFHRLQRYDYHQLHLPPYQFEKTRHWLSWKDTVSETQEPTQPFKLEYSEPVLLRFSRYLDAQQREAEFLVDPRSEQYQLSVNGHAVLAQPLCPAPLYIEIASKSAVKLVSSSKGAGYVPSVKNLNIHAPLGVSEHLISVLLKKSDASQHVWTFTFSSQASDPPSSPAKVHATGTVILQPITSRLDDEFSRLESLVSYKRIQAILSDRNSEALQGAVVYKLFSKVVTYADYYKGVRCVFARDREAAGLITLPKHDKKGLLEGTVFNPLAMDNFIQVSGLHANSLTEVGEGEVFVCNQVERIQPGPSFRAEDIDETKSFLVYSNYRPLSDRELANDIYVFDTETKKLIFLIWGARFTRVMISSLGRVLSHANNNVSARSTTPKVVDLVTTPPKTMELAVSTRDISSELRIVLNSVTEIPLADLSDGITLEELGIDSLMTTEILAEINKAFSVSIAINDFKDMTNIAAIARGLRAQLDVQPLSPSSRPSISKSHVNLDSMPSGRLPSTFSRAKTPIIPDIGKEFGTPTQELELTLTRSVATNGLDSGSVTVSFAQQAFEDIRLDYDIHAKETRFYDFWKKVYPAQAKLVLAYTAEAFSQLKCNLNSLKPGEKLPKIEYLPRHSKLVAQLYNILRDGQLVATDGCNLVRTDQPVNPTPSTSLLLQINTGAPQHASEHELLRITGSKLADCLTGAMDPVNLLFKVENKKHIEDVYANGPMFEAVSRLLCSFLVKAFKNTPNHETIQILELGAGTGGTTRHVIDCLLRLGIPFTYTFSDLSRTLVVAARERFGSPSYMEFQTIDIEKQPAEKFLGKFHAIISTNCIHATRNLEMSARNICHMLREGGFVSLVEFTRNIFWFDLVFGLLEGWWRFNDGREHALASENFWNDSLRKAGFQHVTWTDGESLEARTLRIIAGFKTISEDLRLIIPQKRDRDAGTRVETVLVMKVGPTSLFADIYYPSTISATETRPIALMIHGGGHIMLSRNDVRPKQIAHLCSLGFLPISIDYRLCPETTLPDGPMTDVCDALCWTREKLPHLPLLCPGLKMDTSRVVVVGWSTGGHLAMTTAFTSVQRGHPPPTAILAFYSPSDYEDPHWINPNYPENSIKIAANNYNLLAGVREQPITAYKVSPTTQAVGGWMAPSDLRSQIILHMNWKGQTLPILLRGLPSGASSLLSPSEKEALKSQRQPPTSKIQQISPLAQIKNGVYRTPTFLIHGTEDDLIPWEQSVRTIDTLKDAGVHADIEIVPGKPHLFDLYQENNGGSWEAVSRGYDFLLQEVHKN